MSVGMHLMKQDHRDVKQRDYRGQTSLNGGFQAMEDPREAAHDRKQGERGLDGHEVIPGAPGAPFTVLWHALLAPEAVISQYDPASTERLDKRMELVVRDIHHLPIPVHQPFRSS